MDSDNIPWVPLAMVVIIFVKWLLNQFKKAAAVREERRETMRRRWEGIPDEVPEGVPQGTASVTPPPLRTPQPQAQSSDQPQTLQELFEQRRQEIAEAQRRPVTPPAMPRAQQPAPTLPVIAAPVLKPQPAMKRRRAPVRKNLEGSSIISAFSDQDQIRNAVILREVLDKPKGFEL